jgi:hypothetical protein
MPWTRGFHFFPKRRTKIVKRKIIILRPLAAVCLFILGIGVISKASAQREQIDTFSIVANGGVAVLPNERLKLTVYNPTGVPATSHVKVFSGTGQILLSSANTYVGAGEFHSYDISYTDLGQAATEPQTGRRQVRIEGTVLYTGLESDARRIWSTYDLTSTVTGQSILVGMLLPAIQKVR